MLPKGATVLINVINLHRNPELYLNPLDFNPENFNQENVAKRPKYNFIPFSGGARNCIGKKTLIILRPIFSFGYEHKIHYI